jgi:UDP-N-acetylglucosamine acyltransferase
MTTANIHPTAIVEDGAQIAVRAKIGPFCHIGPKAKIGEDVELMAHVVVMNDTTIGAGTKVFPGAVLGAGPQDHGNEFNDGMKLVIGRDNIIREHVTMQCGTPKEHMTTTVGDGGMFMVNAHVAHDCVVGNNVILTNNVMLAGHVRVDDGAILGGGAAVHQFCHIGRKAMIGGLSGVIRDVIPFGMVTGARASLRSLNLVGLKRSGISKPEVAGVMSAFRFLFEAAEDGSSGTFAERLAEVKEKYAANAMVMEQIAFIENSLANGRRVLTMDVNKD